MDTQNSVHTDASEPKKVYRLSRGQRILAYSLGVILASPSLITPMMFIAGENLSTGEMIVVPSVGLLLIILGVALSASMLRTRLVISSEGVEYRASGMVISTTWENIERIGVMSVPSIITNEALFLREPAFKDSKRNLWARYCEWSTRFMRQANVIPLSPFGRRWCKGELGIDIMRYAPHLAAYLEDVPSDTPSNDVTLPADKASQEAEKPEYEQISGWLIVLAIWLCLGVAVGLVQLITIDIPQLSSEWLLFLAESGAGTYNLLVAIVVETVIGMLMVIFAVVLLTLLFKKRKLFMRAMVIFLLARLLWGLISSIWIEAISVSQGFEVGTAPSGINGITLSSMLVFIYLARSKRVKGTFVK